MAEDFQGFPKEFFSFFKELKKNNNKEWFTEHKPDYVKYVKKPTESFAEALVTPLQKMVNSLGGEKKKMVKRIYRDVRFSQDKTPYKTHQAIMIGHPLAVMNLPVMYFQMSDEKVILGTGMMFQDKDELQRYREKVIAKEGDQLKSELTRLMKRKGTEMMEKNLKKTPRGFDAEHKNAEYLLFKQIHVGIHIKPPKEAQKPGFVDFCAKELKEYVKIHKWLIGINKG